MAKNLTIKQAINGFLEMVTEKTGRLSHDKPWSDRLIYFYLLQNRARILQERKERRKDHSRQSIQTIPCVSLEKVDQNECPCNPPTGCMFLKSKETLPKSVFGNFISVTSTLGNKNYTYLRWEAFEDILHSKNRFEREESYYTLKSFGENQKLYLLNDTEKESVAVTLIAQNPLEVMSFPNCGVYTHICDPFDREFVMDMEALSVLYDRMFERLVPVKGTTQPELFNNQEPDINKKP